jgi:hypothetical protein
MHTQKKRLATVFIATPDEILWKGLEMGGLIREEKLLQLHQGREISR